MEPVIMTQPCLVCRAPVAPFMSFGRMPIANGFLRPEQFVDEHFFELKVAFCDACKMVQLVDLVEPQKMFHENYAFFSSTSSRMAEHFRNVAQTIMTRHASKDGFVVELGSNDGIMLQHIARAGIRHAGVEPSANVAEAARAKGVHTVNAFFDASLAAKLEQEHGKADVVFGANVFCHIPDLHSVAKGIKQLLKPTGVLIFEDPYLGDIIEKTSYDQIYDEHAFYFSAHSVQRLFAPHGLELVDVSPQHVHGGSMRYTLAHAGARTPSPALVDLLRKEQALGLLERRTFDRFRENVEASRADLMDLLRKLKAEGKRVVGYGATSKSTTVTNYCGITPDLVEAISDTTPTKQGKHSPGAHIPIIPYSAFQADPPEYALLFAWNHGEEIMAKETAFTQRGGKFILYVPRLQVVP